MIVDTKYMHRCIQLALKAKGHTSPNPMVGTVVVHNDTIIGEGYHRAAGEGHAEVNAIGSVKNKQLLKESTLYVSLEPCSHQGKTPPCAQLIIDCKIPRVVVGCLDPFPKVLGRGIKMLNNAGITTKVGILESECKQLNKEFNTAHTLNRPYIYLKWAQTSDGFIDRVRANEDQGSAAISNDFTKMLVHKLRAEVDAIMIATNTAVLDNPSLTTRLWYGKNPIRIILDRTLRISTSNPLFDDSVKTYVVTEIETMPTNTKNTEYLHIPFDDDFLRNLFQSLNNKEILSVMIEGGSQFLQTVIDSKTWDEAFVEVASQSFGSGINAPKVEGTVLNEYQWKGSKHIQMVPSHI